MRGAHGHGPASASTAGNIPADAGSTVSDRPLNEVQKDHPRGCGEHSQGIMLDLRYGGSSPRMRGAPTTHDRNSTRRRIIPADAGSTFPMVLLNDSGRDHPRGCGEHLASLIRHMMPSGSSPRMRGAHQNAQGAGRERRIIPADAGSTFPLSCR